MPHDGGHGGTVRAAAEKRARVRPIRTQAAFHGLAQQAQEFLLVAGKAGPRARRARLLEDQLPVAALALLAAAHMQVFSGQQALLAQVSRGRARHHMKKQVVIQRLRIERAPHGRMGQQGIMRGGKEQALRIARIAERMHAGAVHGQQGRTGKGVEDGQREWPRQAGAGRHAPAQPQGSEAACHVIGRTVKHGPAPDGHLQAILLIQMAAAVDSGHGHAAHFAHAGNQGGAIETRQGCGHACQRARRCAIGRHAGGTHAARRRQPTAQAAHTSTSAGSGWPRKAVGLAVKPYAPDWNTTTRSPSSARAISI
ncbi:hypothetical protein D3C81_1382330 [compost metagenome]